MPEIPRPINENNRRVTFRGIVSEGIKKIKNIREGIRQQAELEEYSLDILRYGDPTIDAYASDNIAKLCDIKKRKRERKIFRSCCV